jgi:F-type H+/Na+-transporting ATPase subunit alpha
MVAGSFDARAILKDTFARLEKAVDSHAAEVSGRESGKVVTVGHGIARLEGLPGLQSDELILFQDNLMGMAFNLDQKEVGAILFGKSSTLRAGSDAYRTKRVLDVPVGDALLGRVIDPTGRPLDQRGKLQTTLRRPVEREATGIMDRAPVSVPLQTGIKAIDALIPIGRGQRELILGDRQTGKTAIALDTIINQADQDVTCVYCAIGQRNSAVARFIADLQEHQAMEYTLVVSASAASPPGLQFIAPYAATSMAEYFMEQGRDVLIIYDDLTRHAWAYRELSLLLRRPPGREAYPGDIFYIHSRLLERSTQLIESLGGGSLTALPIAETEAQNISAYIPTNLISITDGQIYLSPELFQKGVLPAVDIGTSVSRVGGKAQLPAYRAVAGDLRLSYSQFEELETFARFGTRLDEETRQTIARGQRVREVLKQPQYQPVQVAAQIFILLAVTSGLFDGIPLLEIQNAETILRQTLMEELSELCQHIQAGKPLEKEEQAILLDVTQKVLRNLEWGADGNA